MSKLLGTVVALFVSALVVVPVVAYATLYQYPGPCSVSIYCIYGGTVRCDGQIQCTESYGMYPYVQCDDRPAWYCGGIEEASFVNEAPSPMLASPPRGP